MSVIGDLMKRISPSVADKLADAKARLAGLEKQADELALAGVLEQPGARERLTAHERQLAAARADVERLQRAHALAVRKDAASDARTRVKQQREQYAALEAQATARHQAMIELSAAIERAAKAYKVFAAATEQMANSLPEGLEWAPAHAHHLGSGQAILAAEFYRHSGVHQIGQKSAFPGSRPPNEIFRFQPERITPAADEIAKSNEYLLSSLRSQLDLRDAAAAEVEQEAA
jgi:hypothetical protein